MNVLAMSAKGETASASVAPDIFYLYQDGNLSEPVKKPSLQVKI